MIGKMFKTTKGEKLVITSYQNSKNVGYKILDKYGHCGVARLHDIMKGLISNPYCKNVYNTGFIGDGIYKAWDSDKGRNTKCYKVWYSMMTRCYAGEDPAYLNVTVCEDWHNFQNFAKWYHSQKFSNLRDYDIDKDIKGGTTYNPENCLIIPRVLNSALVNIRRYSPNLSGNVYVVRISTFGKSRHIGRFKDKKQAVKAYYKEKVAYLRELLYRLDSVIDERTKTGIENLIIEIEKF